MYYKYTEFVSKNSQHWFKDINATNKLVQVYAKPETERCAVKLLDFYLTKLPPNPPAFYVRPLNAAPVDTEKPRYCRKSVGVSKLKSILPELSEEAGLDTRYTNHSLRATAVTRMYVKGVPEKIIAEKSGHRSLKALRAYERTSSVQEKAAVECVQSGKQFEESVTEEAMASAEEKIQPFSVAPTECKQKKPGVPEGLQKMMQQFSGIQTVHSTSIALDSYCSVCCIYCMYVRSFAVVQ